MEFYHRKSLFQLQPNKKRKFNGNKNLLKYCDNILVQEALLYRSLRLIEVLEETHTQYVKYPRNANVSSLLN